MKTKRFELYPNHWTRTSGAIMHLEVSDGDVTPASRVPRCASESTGPTVSNLLRGEPLRGAAEVVESLRRLDLSGSTLEFDRDRLITQLESWCRELPQLVSGGINAPPRPEGAVDRPH
jgi:hypothetical protein